MVKSKVLLTLSSSMIVFGVSLTIIVLDMNVIARVLALLAVFSSGFAVCFVGYFLSWNWVSVEQELPAKRGRYLVNLNGSVVDIVYFSNGEWQDKDKFKSQCITHWMPVPLRPRASC